MENLYIEETKCTPLIEGNVNGSLSIKGNCFPENSLTFFESVGKTLKTKIAIKIINSSNK